MSVLNLWQRCLLASKTVCRKTHLDITAEYLTNCNWLTINSSTQTANERWEQPTLLPSKNGPSVLTLQASLWSNKRPLLWLHPPVT